MEIGLQVFGRSFELRTKAIPLQPLSARGGWWTVIRESLTGAWQRNIEVNMDTVLTYSAVFACVTLIASDIAKLCLRLVEQDADGIWTETESPAFSPVLRKPNRYQNRIKFIEQWLVSKLVHGNTYVLKQRDNRGGPSRGVVTAMYVLDPSRVTPLVAADGSVYYELKRDDLSGLANEKITVPASEIIHDTMVALYHPLIGVSPIYACGTAAMQGIAIQNSSTKFFDNGSQPGAILTAPKGITDEQAARLKDKWESEFGGDNYGKIAVIGGELNFNQLSQNAVDAQLIEQLKWTGENVCTCFHVPPYMVGIGPPPPYANIEPLLQQYYSQCIQSLTVTLETCLDEGLGLTQKIDGKQYGTEFDIDDLIWMDTAVKTKAAGDAITHGVLSPNEGRKKYFGVGPVPGGETPYMQEQQWPLRLLAQRTLPTRAPTAPAELPTRDDADDDEELAAAFMGDVLHKTLAGLHAA